MKRRQIRINGVLLNPPEPTPERPRYTGYTRGGAVPAFTLFNEHAIDQLLLQQCAYTDFDDTLENPNMALRNPGDAELIFRRMTFGDNLLMLAVNLANLKYRSMRAPSQELPAYWSAIWHQLMRLLCPDNREPALSVNPLVALAVSHDFCIRTAHRGTQELTVGDLTETFMTRGRAFFTGVRMSHMRVRGSDNRFKPTWIVLEAESEDHMFLTATSVLLYAIDNIARGVLNANVEAAFDPMRVLHDHYKDKELPVARWADEVESLDMLNPRHSVEYERPDDGGLIRSLRISRVTPDGTELTHGYQEANDDTGPGDGSVSVNRLLP
jgi:hypothetical protein